MTPVKELQRQIDRLQTTIRQDGWSMHRQTELDHLGRRLRNAEAEVQVFAKAAKEREQADQAHHEASRAALEADLIAKYQSAVPGSTEREARAKLPQLIEEHRQATMTREDAVLADTVARYRARAL